MAFAVTGYKTYPIASAGSDRRFRQVTVFTTTATAADVDYDFGDGAAGTFFTSAIADGTHGAKATALAAHLAALTAKTVDGGVSIKSNVFGVDYVNIVTVAGAGQYSLAYDATSKNPEVLFNAADGPTSATWVIEHELLEAATPVAPASAGTI